MCWPFSRPVDARRVGTHHARVCDEWFARRLHSKDPIRAMGVDTRHAIACRWRRHAIMHVSTSRPRATQRRRTIALAGREGSARAMSTKVDVLRRRQGPSGRPARPVTNNTTDRSSVSVRPCDEGRCASSMRATSREPSTRLQLRSEGKPSGRPGALVGAAMDVLAEHREVMAIVLG